jgi:hypothetical protein
MKYRIVAQVTDDAGSTTEVELMPETVSQPGWRCSHAIWPHWVKDVRVSECEWCREPLVACEFVECPWCESYVATDAVIDHWDRWCDDEPEPDQHEQETDPTPGE